MKIPNRQQFQQIAFKHSLDTDLRDFMNLYKKCTAKPHSLLVIHANLALDNSSRFTENLLERI